MVSLRRWNDLLSIVVVALAVYILLWPFLPSLAWWAKYQAPLISHTHSTVLAVTDPTPDFNALVIPKLDMRQQVHDGKTALTLSKGIWHIPGSSTPDKGGNTVMAGHRFTYSGKAVFYYLDKVAVGDSITTYWGGKRYDYHVSLIKEVSPDDTTLVQPTDNPKLTIYTCTPLWSAKHRLIIQADLVETP